MKIRSTGVVKLTFNGKSRNTSLFTYNLQKETDEQLTVKLREKIVDFFSFYAELNNKTPLKNIEIFSSDFLCTSGCKIDILKTKVSVIGVIYQLKTVRAILEEEAQKFGIQVELPNQ